MCKFEVRNTSTYSICVYSLFVYLSMIYQDDVTGIVYIDDDEEDDSDGKSGGNAPLDDDGDDEEEEEDDDADDADAGAAGYPSGFGEGGKSNGHFGESKGYLGESNDQRNIERLVRLERLRDQRLLRVLLEQFNPGSPHTFKTMRVISSGRQTYLCTYVGALIGVVGRHIFFMLMCSCRPVGTVTSEHIPNPVKRSLESPGIP